MQINLVLDLDWRTTASRIRKDTPEKHSSLIRQKQHLYRQDKSSTNKHLLNHYHYVNTTGEIGLRIHYMCMGLR
eukprot:c2477_g1_i2 orf=499-720(-)